MRTMAYALFVACGLAASALAQSPASELQAAVADIERLPSEYSLRAATEDRLKPGLQPVAVTVDGDWLPADDMAKLRAYSTSAGAILRADDFVARATVSPRYYEFAGVPATEGEFLKSLGVDAATIDRLRGNAGANLLISGVTQKPRRIVWSQ